MGSSERQKENSISKEVHKDNQLPHMKTSSISNLSTLFNPFFPAQTYLLLQNMHLET